VLETVWHHCDEALSRLDAREDRRVVRLCRTQRYSEGFRLEVEGQGVVNEVDFELTFSFLVVKVAGCRHHFCSAEL